MIRLKNWLSLYRYKLDNQPSEIIEEIILSPKYSCRPSRVRTLHLEPQESRKFENAARVAGLERNDLRVQRFFV